ncbi:hypothetical protein [Sphingobacterium multivorum]|uniref:hypothetical protein n=1 Tax=Sphingobacterium multivorum TaxID=28454 RepID=UPI0031BA0485
MKIKFITTFLAIIPGILIAQSSDPNIEVNMESPAYGINIKTNFAWQNGIWARGYRISNHNNSEYFIHFGAMGTFNNGISKQNYGYIGKDWNQTYMVFLPNGNIGIGTMDPQDKLAVKGKIRAEEIKVTTSAADWPDYVFKADYNLRSLAETERYINEHGHLPDVPKAEEAETEGVSLGQMNKILLKKIEEMTLQLIQLNHEVKIQTEQVKLQSEKIKLLESR